MIKVYGLSAFLPHLKGLVRDIRVVWTCEEVGEQYERVVMDPIKREHKSADYLKINPFGKVPAIQDGDFTLFESLAICTYLGDKKQKLLPKAGTKERALYDQWTAFAVSTFEPYATRVVAYDFFTKDKDAAGDKARKENLAVLDGFMATMDTVFQKQAYLLGEHFSIADIMFSSVCRAVGHTDTAAKHANLTAYLKKNYERPAFKTAFEKNG